MPVFSHNVEDIQTFRMIISQIYLNGSAKQSEICRAFGVTPISVKRSVKLYREKGTAGRRSRGAVVLTPNVLEKAQRLFDDGLEVNDVAEKLGFSF